jgi:hypothetical protein
MYSSYLYTSTVSDHSPFTCRFLSLSLSLSLSVDCVFVFVCELFPYLLLSKQVVPAFREVCDLEIGRIGPIIHEMIHPFGLPEMYDVEGGYGTGNIGGIDR